MREEVEQALTALHNNEPGAAERAIALLQNTVFAFSMKMCGHREDAEDTMQETLLKAALRLPNFSSAKALAVWLYKVAKNQCLMSRRKSKFAPHEQLSLEALMPDVNELEGMSDGARGPAPDRLLLRHENAEQVQRAILKLPPEYRLILVLHDMEELSNEEVALITGLREGTVRVRLHRARTFLRNELAGRGRQTGRKVRRRAERSPTRRPSNCKKLFLELSDYLDGQLDPSLCSELEQHLSGCEACQTFLTSLERTVLLLRQHKTPALSAEAAKQRRFAVMAEFRRAMRTVSEARPAVSA